MATKRAAAKGRTRSKAAPKAKKAAAKTAPAAAQELFRRLAAAIPSPECELDHEDAWSLLIATILSAQNTDAMVNRVTPVLFAKWPTPRALADAPTAEVEQVVKPTGFFRNKTKAIQGASRAIAEQHGGEVPRDLDALLALPGVARKTANVVLGTAYGIPTGVVVDTHVLRVAARLGLTAQTDPVKVEKDLLALLPEDDWIDGGHRLLLHGRYVCTARDPDCPRCPLNELCPSRQAPPAGTWAQRAAREEALVVSRGRGGASALGDG